MALLAVAVERKAGGIRCHGDCEFQFVDVKPAARPAWVWIRSGCLLTSLPCGRDCSGPRATGGEPKMTSAVQEPVRTWLRFEGLAALVLSTYLYATQGGSWFLFGALFLVPDISFAGYLAGPRIGAMIYNLAHSYVGPLTLAGAHFVSGMPGLLLAMVWGAHIGFDRTLGYGLKYSTAFGDTHLGRIGRAA
jgi:hypothetical protein